MKLTLLSHEEQKLSVILRGLTLLYIVYRSYSHQSLTNSGLIVAFLTGLIHSLPPSNLPLILIVTFFITSTIATKYKDEIKSKKTKLITTESSNKATKRTHVQVLCNSAVGSLLILISIFIPDNSYIYNLLTVGIITQYTCVIADTWSSELGILSTSNPYLITTFKQVPPGTNGGVSKAGLLAGFIGSFVISLISVICLNVETKLLHLIYFTVIGFIGTLIDSLLGSLFQCSVVGKEGLVLESTGGQQIEYMEIKEEIKVVAGLDVMSNNGVNFVTGVLTVLLGIGCYDLFF
ncbi:hypothetical protein WICPIJ_005099 [Wickerhamomyces pijperi]|uniref:Transmembrane protein 19 n=1 Tax=Wickerhamomyces pijperi TaxID=599730 RepID=A0A9P8TM85_WICPI|nr:hypothetical protein WICPIJ_005099 [Wickerhamomyces pijperi]